MNDKPFEIRQLTKEDLPAFRSLIDLFQRVFEEPQTGSSSDAHLLRLMGNESFVALAAFSENEVVGGLTAYELPMYETDSSEMLLYDLAIKPEYQRKGIGKALLQHLKRLCSRNEIRDLFVLVHEEDEHAAEFYRATGGKGEKVINFLYDTSGRE